MTAELGGIYALSFLGSTRFYVGSAKNIRRRLVSHLHQLRKGRHHAVALQRAANKYGLDNLTITVLEAIADPELLVLKEQIWIDRIWGKHLNGSPSAQSRLGMKMPDSAKMAISQSLKGNKFRSGIPHDQETKDKISSGVVRANATGRRKQGRNCPENLAAFNEAVRSGQRRHPKSNPDRDAAIAEKHRQTGSLNATGMEFGITASAVWCVVRRVAPKQLRKWTRK